VIPLLAIAATEFLHIQMYMHTQVWRSGIHISALASSHPSKLCLCESCIAHYSDPLAATCDGISGEKY